MPELPEVETTVRGLNKNIKNQKITDVWTSYNSTFHKGKNNIKDKAYFPIFKKLVVGQKVKNVVRRGKNILIRLDNNHTIIAHMKMTGHFLYGKYIFDEKNKTWCATESKTLQNPFSRFIRLTFTLSSGNNIAFSDMRKFAKVFIIKTTEEQTCFDLKNLGPEPLEPDFSPKILREQLLKKPNGKIKTVLMDQSLISGIGNIYSDEILWASNIHPLESPKNLAPKQFQAIFMNTLKILTRSIEMGGDSMSDYRNVLGEKGNFQNAHRAYRQTDKICQRKGCGGIINRLVVGGRSTHFCPKHQKLAKPISSL